MTSISPPVLPPQASSNASQSAAQAHPQSGSTSGKTPPQAAGTAPATARSYASVSKKQFSPTASNIASSPVAVGGSGTSQQHGRLDSVNGKGVIPPAVPSVGTPTIINGNIAISPTSGPNDHSRKSSVTISAAGASGYMPNGGPVAGKQAGGSNIQFGSIVAGGSPSMANSTPQSNASSNSLAVHTPSNPRITSPQTSPSPIPQPPASGGRPPSSLQGQGNALSFGSLGGDDTNVSQHVDNRRFMLTVAQRQMRPMGIPQGPQGPLAPGPPPPGHSRRESSQSAHSDLGNPGMGPGGGRGGYPQQSGRGRGAYGPQYPPPMGFSPGPSYRPPPNQPRGGQNMPSPFQPQSRSLAPYQNSPHQAARSPALANAQPAHLPQPGQMPMGNAPLYPQQFTGFPANMVAPTVKPQSSSSSYRNSPISEQHVAPFPLQSIFRAHPPPDLSPHSGHFEQYLTMRNQNQYMGQGFDPGYAAAFFHQQQQFNMHPMGYMPPSSPRPHHPMPQDIQQPYIRGQYGNPPQTQQMSRNSSAISASDRPSSSLGKSQNSIPPAVSHAPSTNSPAPANTEFKIPPRKKAGIVIKDPSGDVITFDKPSASPAPSTRSPAIVSSSPTPPSRTPSHADVSHNRTDSKAAKTTDEIKHNLWEQVTKKLEADKAEEKRLKDEADSKALDDQKEAEAKALKAKEEEQKKRDEAARAQLEAVEAAKVKAEAEKAAAKIKEDEERAQKEKEEEEEFIRAELEMERKEREIEERYLKKKQAEKEEKERKAAEAAARADEEMRKAEKAMEEAEDARLKKLEENDGEDSHKERVNLFAALKKDAPVTPSSETPTATETPVESGTATPVSDVSMALPQRIALGEKQKPKPAHLKLETSKSVEPAQPSAALLSLRSARRLASVNDISYPAPFASPNPALNTAAPSGKFRYDKEFLLQFQRAFVEKPSENWTERIKETVGDTTEPSSARATSARGAPPMGARQPSSRGPIPIMGTFGAPGGRSIPSGTPQARYQTSTPGLAAAQKNPMQNPLASFVANRPGGFPMGMPKPMERTSSSTSLANHPSSPRGNPSQRGPSTRGSNRGSRPPHQNDKLAKEMPLTAGKDLKPIEVSASGWKPRSVGVNATGIAGPAPGGDGHMAPDVVQRKVKSNLNKMTPNNFDKIADQILAIAGQSKDETDGRTLRQVIQLTFEKATDEAHWAQMYAEFCKRMLESMSPEIKDVRILDKKDNVVVGGALFRKYLLTRCQEEFERGWKTDLPQKPEGESTEAAMLSDEYYIAAAAKRRGLGLVRFIGELYKLGMLTERIMHECVKKLVDYEGTPDEAEVESLTSLLRTIGENLDSTERGKGLMDAYFKRIGAMIETPGLQSRLTFMLMVRPDLPVPHGY